MSTAGDEGPGIRVKRKRTFTVIYNDQFVPGMSLRAWGLYCHLSGKPDGWDARVYSLQREFKEGRDAIYTALKELVELELVTKEEWMDGNLKRTRYVLEVDGPSSSDRRQTCRSAPDTDSQGPETQDSESPGPENPSQVKTDSVSTDQASTDQCSAATAARSGTSTGQKQRKESTKTAQARALDDQAQQLTKPWWDNLKATRPERLPAQSYIAVRGVVRQALANGKPGALIIAGLNHLVGHGVAISGGSLTNAMTTVAGLPTAPEEFRAYAVEQQARPQRQEPPRVGSGVWDRVVGADRGRETA